MVLIPPYIMYMCDDKTNGDSFPRKQGKKKEMLRLLEEKNTRKRQITAGENIKQQEQEGKQD